jgi:hypothetical protein
VANTTGRAWKFTRLTCKTDNDDARRLAEPEAIGQSPIVSLHPSASATWCSTRAGFAGFRRS